MKTHIGEKPYQCGQREKALSHYSHLVRHMRTHTEEKPYQCSHCEKDFL